MTFIEGDKAPKSLRKKEVRLVSQHPNSPELREMLEAREADRIQVLVAESRTPGLPMVLPPDDLREVLRHNLRTRNIGADGKPIVENATKRRLKLAVEPIVDQGIIFTEEVRRAQEDRALHVASLVGQEMVLKEAVRGGAGWKYRLELAKVRAELLTQKGLIKLNEGLYGGSRNTSDSKVQAGGYENVAFTPDQEAAYRRRVRRAGVSGLATVAGATTAGVIAAELVAGCSAPGAEVIIVPTDDSDEVAPEGPVKIETVVSDTPTPKATDVAGTSTPVTEVKPSPTAIPVEIAVGGGRKTQLADPLTENDAQFLADFYGPDNCSIVAGSRGIKLGDNSVGLGSVPSSFKSEDGEGYKLGSPPTASEVVYVGEQGDQKVFKTLFFEETGAFFPTGAVICLDSESKPAVVFRDGDQKWRTGESIAWQGLEVPLGQKAVYNETGTLHLVDENGQVVAELVSDVSSSEFGWLPIAPAEEPTSTPTSVSITPEATAIPEKAELTVVSETLNIRKGPGTNYPAFDSAQKGDSFEVVGKAANGWLEIRLADGTEGFVSGGNQYVETSQLVKEMATLEPSEIPAMPKTETNTGYITDVVPTYSSPTESTPMARLIPSVVSKIEIVQEDKASGRVQVYYYTLTGVKAQPAIWIDKDMLTFSKPAITSPTVVEGNKGVRTVEVTQVDPNPNMQARRVIGKTTAFALYRDLETRYTVVGLVKRTVYQIDKNGNVSNILVTLDVGRSELIVVNLSPNTLFLVLDSEYQDIGARYSIPSSGVNVISHLRIGDTIYAYINGDGLPKQGEVAVASGIILE